ncbi:hypothetical protein DC498_17680 [Terrimonas sp.]|uniref:hypothetical protein n=1 Tax=Terrimonas sp. TaxID=1914338 RepID=UPI000D51BE96|nr:hypothetical protein [Terrimonas sp.]PVD50803.1 hypothetical protein DC498_17680 [Terrimonas sp.]
MNWRFSLLDRAGKRTVIDEPVGWDATKIVINRDKELHGLFFDYQGNDFKFYDKRKGESGTFDVPYDEPFSADKPGGAFGIIKDEYDNYGVQGNLVLIIEQKCSNDFVELYRGTLAFREYEDTCGDECFCRIPIETTSDVITLNNRWDQKVNLESLLSFDQVTNLEPYAFLGKKIELKSKGVYMQNKATLNENKELLVKLSDIGFLFPPNAPDNRYAWFNMVLPFNNTDLSEFGNFNPSTDIMNTFIGHGTYNANVLPNGATDAKYITKGDDQGLPNENVTTVYFDWAPTPYTMYFNPDNPNNLDFVRSFNLEVSVNYTVNVKDALVKAWHNAILKRKADGEIEVIDNNIQVNQSTLNFNGWEIDTDHTVNYSKELVNVTLEKGEYLFFCVAGLIRFWSGELETGEAFKITVNSGSINIDTLSFSQPTAAKLFLVNEAWSRIAEAVTDGKIKAYSEYFGRKDSQPYSVESDGCGSLEAITNGLFIRGIEKKEDSNVIFSQSLKDLWDGLDPIHHIGVGIERDLRRSGYKWLRVEPWKYFYSQDIILTLDGVNSITRKVQESEHYSTFTFGYEKYEAEEYNGLDEFLTQRFYRTTLSEVKNELNRLSKMIASGYAIEITRRKGNKDSKDWRFDNDTFIICLKRGLPALPAEQYNVRFYHTSIRFAGITEAPAWAIIGQKITISGAQTSGNNKTFTINNAYVSGGDFYISVSSYPVNDSTVQPVTVTPVYDSDALTIEMGNITNPGSIIDPDTIYNFRISPIRNAMRWTDKIFSGYRSINSGSQAIFMEGKGNYFASGYMSGSCVIELQAIAENETIDITKFAEASFAIPPLRPERISFDYPMSVADFKTIQENPYGVIKIVDSCEELACWIDEINYTPEEGMANFKLIPAYNNDAFIVPQGIFATEFITTMQ